MRFSVLTLNLWKLNEPLAARNAALAAGLKILRPDIVCLQEVAGRQSALVAEACELPHVIDNGALSILSRTPIARSHNAALPEAARDEPRQVLLVETSIEGRPLLVANTHLAWRPEMVAERKAQVAALLAAIKREPTKTKILVGDFNDDPDSPALRLVSDSGAGLHDTYAACRPDNPGFTWSRKNPFVSSSTARDQRIDYIFTSGDLKPTDCTVVFDGGNGLGVASDHYGVFCRVTGV